MTAYTDYYSTMRKKLLAVITNTKSKLCRLDDRTIIVIFCFSENSTRAATMLPLFRDCKSFSKANIFFFP